MTNVKLWLLNSNILNHLTVCKKWAQAYLKNVIYKIYLQIIYI